VEMVKSMKPVLFLLIFSPAWGGDFTLTIGSPAAASLPSVAGKAPAQVSKVKTDAVLAVRSEGCADPAKARITGSAEGLVNGARQTVPLSLIPGQVPGVYIVSRDWPYQGVWVVNLSGSCASAKAGALVPIGPAGFLRESSKFFPRSPTEAEIQASLKSLSGGPK
jgi:hypothetical protein